MRIAVIGAGAIGQAIAGLLHGREKITIDFWDTDLSKVPDQKPLPEVITQASLVFVCVPSFAVRAVAEDIKPHLRLTTPVVSVAKGIEAETHKTMDEVLQESLSPDQPMALFCGPMLAHEIMKGMPSAAVVGTKTRRVFTRLKQVFAGTTLRVEHSRDIHGVALVSVLKNIYAIGVGVGEGLGYGDNFRGWFMNQAAHEMVTILKLLGGKSVTVYSSAGLGDFIATGVSPYSRNHTVGKEIGTQGQTHLTSEGLQSLPSLLYLVGDHMGELPLLKAICDIVVENRHAQPIFQTLLTA